MGCLTSKHGFGAIEARAVVQAEGTSLQERLARCAAVAWEAVQPLASDGVHVPARAALEALARSARYVPAAHREAVLSKARPLGWLARRTFEALQGVPKAIVHLALLGATRRPVRAHSTRSELAPAVSRRPAEGVVEL